MKKVFAIFVTLLFLSTAAFAEECTTVNSSGEENLYDIINNMMGTTFGSSSELCEYEVVDDGLWFEMNGHISITATYAAYTQELSWVTTEDSGFILFRDDDGYSFDLEEFNTTGGGFYFKDETTGGVWSSQDSENPDGLNHMITYDMRDYEDWTFICAFEDWPGLGDGDYNDLVFKITLAAPTSVCLDDGCPPELAACPQAYVTGGHAPGNYFYPRDPVTYNYDYQILGGLPDTEYKVTGIAYSWYPGRLVSDNQRTAKKVVYVTGPGSYNLSFSKNVPRTVDLSFGDPYGVTVEWTFTIKEVGGGVLDTCDTQTYNAFYVESKP